MTMILHTEISINATPEKIWNVLTDFNAYPTWNPLVKSLTGNVAVGNIIKVQLDSMTFKPEVLVYDRNKEFEWKGHLLFKGLFDGKHRFLLQDNEDGTTQFVHSENFKGLLVPLMKKKLNTEVKASFEALNEALKEVAERVR